MADQHPPQNRPGASTTTLALPVLEELCPRCRVAGLRISPDWAAWHEQCRAAQAAWIVQHGALTGPNGNFYDSAAWRQLAAETPTEPEPDQCPTCGNTGYIPTAAGQDLLGFVRRHLVRDAK